MRLSYLFVALISATILFLSSTVDNKLDTLAAITGQGEPILPETPYEYGDFEFGEYLTEFGIIPYYHDRDTIIYEDITNEGATLGRVLFYDELLSANENLSCATCHKQEFSFAEETPFSEGVDELTKRNSPHLNDLGWSNNYAFFWDMSQSSLKEMIALPLKNPNEIGLSNLAALKAKMEATSYYSPLFADAFGNSTITLERIQEALRQFIASLNTFNSKFDRVERQEAEATVREKKGKEIYVNNCATCHWQATPSGLATEYPQRLINTQGAFYNRLEPGTDEGARDLGNSMKYTFKVPTLRNLKYTAPYMHDGRFSTLEEVIEHYSTGATGDVAISRVPPGGYHFSQEEKEALLDFMDTFNDDSFITEVKWSDPFGTTTATHAPENALKEVSIYPNPSNGLTNVVFENITAQKIEAYLLNMEGKMIRKFSTHKNGFQTDVSMLSAGTYILKIRDGDTFIDKKLIVQ